MNWFDPFDPLTAEAALGVGTTSTSTGAPAVSSTALTWWHLGWGVELWDDLQAANGSRLARLGPLTDGSMTRSIDPNSESMSFTVPASSRWLSSLQLRSALRVTDHLMRVTEWRVSQVQQQRGQGEAEVTITGVTPLTDLGQLRIQDPTSDGQSWQNLGGVQSKPTHYLESYLLPATTREGMNYVAVGQIDSSEKMDLAWDHWTGLQMAQELASRGTLELGYERDGSSGYNVVLRTERGSTAPVRLLSVGRNLSILSWKRQASQLKTVVVPTGMTVPGAVEASNIGQATWRVSAATTSSATLIDPASSGGDGPVAFNDQLTSAWMLLPDASLIKITSASTSQVLAVATTAVSVGDHVEIRASSNGAWLTELVNPDQASTDLYGRVLAVYEDQQGRGERNYVRNGLLGDWNARPAMIGGIVTSATAGAVTLESLPASAIIHAGDVLHRYTRQQFAPDLRVTADVTASTAGTATVTISTGATIGSSSGERVWVSQQSSSQAPTGWSADANSAAHIIVQRRLASLAGDVGGLADGAQVVGSQTSTSNPNLKLKSLLADTVIGAGDILSISTGARLRIMGAAVATSSGAATISVHGAYSLPDGASVTVQRPTLSMDAGPYYAAIPYQGGEGQYIDTPSYTIRYDSTLPVLWLNAGVSYHALDAVTLAQQTTGTHVLRVQLWDVSSSGAITSITDMDRSFAANEVQEVNLRVATNLTATRQVMVRLKPPVLSALENTLVIPDPWLYVRYVSLTLSPDPDVPPIEGSYGTALWQAANRKLVDWSADPDVFEVSAYDLSAMPGYASTEEDIVLGGTVRLYDPTLGIDKQLRIVQITQDMVDPRNVRLTLAKRQRLLSDLVATQTGRTKVTVQVDIAGSTGTGTAGGGAGVPISSDPQLQTAVGLVTPGSPNQAPARQTGAYRIVPGATSSTGNISRQIYNG